MRAQLTLCDICGAANFKPWLEVSLCGVSNQWIHRCSTCGFRQIRPRLAPEELSALYPADYFDPAGWVGYHDYAREAQRRTRDAYFLARRMRGRVPNPRVLEVGCALGFLLKGLQDAGCNVDGVDASPFGVHYATTRFNLPVVCGTLEEARFPDESFDLVIQKDLLEHVLYPRQHLLETCRVMRKGAELWLVTPNGEANLRPLSASRQVSDATQRDLPLLDQGHLSFFSQRHLRRLFTECGFTVSWARTIGVRRGLRALGFLPGQQRFIRRAARVDSSVSISADRDSIGDHDFSGLAERIDTAIKEHHNFVRGWLPYYYIHRVGKTLDALPTSTALGYDYEFLLRKD